MAWATSSGRPIRLSGARWAVSAKMACRQGGLGDMQRGQRLGGPAVVYVGEVRGGAVQLHGQRAALSKARRQPTERCGYQPDCTNAAACCTRTSQEGRGDVGLRLDQLTTVLAGAGVLRLVNGTWQVTPAGQVLLG